MKIIALLMAASCLIQAIKFEPNKESIYLGENASAITQLKGDDAIDYLQGIKTFAGKKMLVNAYHPQSQECKSMVKDYEKLAQKVKELKLPLQVVAINMSKTNEKKSGIDKFPTVMIVDSKPLSDPVSFKGTDYSYAVLEKFLKDNGFGEPMKDEGEKPVEGQKIPLSLKK